MTTPTLVSPIEIDDLYVVVASDETPRSFPEMTFGNVAIVKSHPAAIGFQIGDTPRYVLTRFSGELSWLMSRLMANSLLASCDVSAEEIGMRLLSRAERYQRSGGWQDEDPRGLLMEVLDEACSIVGERDKEALHTLDERLGQLVRKQQI